MGIKLLSSLGLVLAAVVIGVMLQPEGPSHLEGYAHTTARLTFEGFLNKRRNEDALQKFAGSLYAQQELPLNDKVYVITGATSGLGRGIAAHVLALGATLLLPVRRKPNNFIEELIAQATSLRAEYGGAPASLGFDRIKLYSMDLSDLKSVKSCVVAIANDFDHIDVVISNAGMINHNGMVSAQGYELSFAVSCLGAAHFSKLLLASDLLKPVNSEQRSRILSISSEDHRLGQQINLSAPLGSHSDGGGFLDAYDLYGYSKLAQTTFFLELANHHRDEVVVIDVCPGPVASDIAADVPYIGWLVRLIMKALFPSPKVAALPILRLATAPEYNEYSGQHFHMSEARLAREDARDPKAQKWMWEETSRLLNQDYS